MHIESSGLAYLKVAKRHLSSGVGTMHASQSNLWAQTIQLLFLGSQLPNICNKTSVRARSRASFDHDGGLGIGPSLHRVVSFIERTSSSTVTIAWRDPTSCSYGAQIWMGKRKGCRCLRAERRADKTGRSNFSSAPLDACTGERRGHDSCVSDRGGETGLNASVTARFIGRNGVLVLSPVQTTR